MTLEKGPEAGLKQTLTRVQVLLLLNRSRCLSMKVEQRVEPAKKAAQVLHKKLQACMQSQAGLDAERRMVLKLL